MTWGSWGKQLSKAQMATLIHQCIEHGITTFDHADIYGDYGNEEAFGDAFSESAIERAHVQIITKCGIQMTKGRDNRVKHYQYDADYIIWSADRSLKNLKVEYLDMFLLHRPSALMVPDEIAKAVDTLKQSGKIRQFGVSNFTSSQIALLEKSVAVEANQVEFSLTHVDPMEDGTFDDCMLNGRMAMAWSPLGTYFKSEDKRNAAISAELRSMTKKYGVDESQLLLAFLLKHPCHVHAVVGTTNSERLARSMEATNIELDLQDWFILLEASKGRRVP